MKTGLSLFALALAAGSTSAFAQTVEGINSFSKAEKIAPISVNGVPFKGGFSDRAVVVTAYQNDGNFADGSDNPGAGFFSTSSVPNWHQMDDLGFAQVPADAARAGDPPLGQNAGQLGGNYLTDQFGVGFVWAGGANPAPARLLLTVELWNQDIFNTNDTPVNRYADTVDPLGPNIIGVFGVVFDIGARTGNGAFTSVLFGVTDASSNPVHYLLPSATFGMSYRMRVETAPGSNTFVTAPNGTYTGAFVNAPDTVDPLNVGPAVGGSSGINMRDINGDLNFTQPPGVNEYRTFAQPTQANLVFVVTGSCASDFDGDGFPTGDDFDAYVTAFEAGDISSDFDGDGFVTGDDFDKFVVAFEKGC